MQPATRVTPRVPRATKERLNKGDMGEFVPRVGKPEGAKPRLKRVRGYTLPPSRFQRATSLSEGGSYATFQAGVNMPVACWLAAEGCRGE